MTDIPPGYEAMTPDPTMVPGGGADLSNLPPGYEPGPPLQQPQTFGQSLRDAGNMTGTMGINAVSSLVGMPHLAASLADKGIDWVGSQISPSYQGGRPGMMTRATPSAQDVSKNLFDLTSYLSQATGGQPVQPYQPKNAAERETMSLGTAGLAAAVGDPRTALSRVTSALTGDVGSQIASKMVPGSAIAPYIGALIGGSAAGLPSAAMNRSLAAIPGLGTETEVTAANRRLGINNSLIGDASQSPTLQLIQNTGARMPGGGAIHEAQRDAINEWSDALEHTANGLAPPRDAVQAGTALQTATQNWLDRFRTDSRAAYHAVDMQMPGTTPVPLPNYARTLTDVRSNMASMPATAETVTPSLSRNLLDNLISDAQHGTPDWQAVSTLRTKIGEMLQNPPLVGDTSRAELERIYRSLTGDMGAAVAQRGPAAQAAWDTATDLTRNGHDFINNTASRLLAPRGGIKPEQAISAAFGDDGTTLASIRQQMPQAADELAAYKLRDASLATPGRQNATATRTSPTTFGTDMSRLQPTAHDALFGADPALAARVQDLRTSANSMAETERLLNTSGTGAHVGTLAAVEGGMELIPRLAEAFANPSVANFGKVAGAAVPLAAGPVLSRIATNPFLVNAYSKIPPFMAQSASGRRAAAVGYPALTGGLLSP